VEWVNITAKSLPEAIDLALDNLGVDESEAEIEVLEEPRQGLFGRLRGNARVRARVKPKGTRPKVDRGRNRKRRPEGEGAGAAPAGGDAGGRAAGAGNGRSRTRSVGGGRSDEEQTTSEGGGEVTVATADDAPRGGGDRNRNGRSGRSRSGESGGRSSSRGRSGGEERQSREPVEEASVEEVSAQLETFLSGLSTAFGFGGQVSVRPADDDGLLGMVEGRHGLLVGPRARTLDAIQELARVSVQRSAPSSIRIKVDVGGYREVRKEALRQFALEAAAAVRLDGRERSLEPMSSADRKIVHDTLSEEAGVETRSAGAEPHRRVVVMAAEAAKLDRQVEEEQQSANGSEPSATLAMENSHTQAGDNSGDDAGDVASVIDEAAPVAAEEHDQD
jgi:spoIIIJ-associated protein